MHIPVLAISETLVPCPSKPALIWAHDITPPGSSDTLPVYLQEILPEIDESPETFWPEGLKKRVRDMLRYGKYKPSGRAKPSSELLLKMAASRDFPTVNAPVDINNYISLASGYPCSVFDLDKTGPELSLRRGLEGEEYTFNTAGHVIKLTDLLLVAHQIDGLSVPCGNPVKDSMATKVGPDTRTLVAVIYAPHDEPEERLNVWVEKYQELLRQYAGAKQVGRIMGI
jgi:DNA/RNA-binding domain of Phe-tRNA-synthetase-like protein